MWGATAMSTGAMVKIGRETAATDGPMWTLPRHAQMPRPVPMKDSPRGA
jgi:hypothetical protein